MFFCIVLFRIFFVLYYIVSYCIVLYCIVSYFFCIVLYCIVLYCIVSYCIISYCIATTPQNRQHSCLIFRPVSMKFRNRSMFVVIVVVEYLKLQTHQYFISIFVIIILHTRQLTHSESCLEAQRRSQQEQQELINNYINKLKEVPAHSRTHAHTHTHTHTHKHTHTHTHTHIHTYIQSKENQMATEEQYRSELAALEKLTRLYKVLFSLPLHPHCYPPLSSHYRSRYAVHIVLISH